MDELISLLRNSLLPKSHYETKTLMQQLNLGDKTIHACENGCVLYQTDTMKQVSA
jgi:hypothetical protein